MSKITEITIETERVISLSRRCRAVERFCVDCGKLTMMIRPKEAAYVVGGNLRTIFRAIEAGTLHSVEPSGGTFLVCLTSLLKAAASGEI